GLYEAETRARDQVGRLQRLTSSFSAAADVSQVVAVVLDQALPALGARAGSVLLLGDSGMLELADSRGYEAVADEIPRELALDAPYPAAEAVRTGEIVVLESEQERRERYVVPDAFRAATGAGTVVVVPLLVGNRAIGCVGFSLDEQRPLADE